MRQSLVITETDPMLKALYMDLMEDMNVDVTFINSLDGLSSVLKQQLPSLILVAYEGSNKLEEYCAYLRDDEIYKSIPIMLVTAREDMGTRLEATRMGVDYVMYKPFSLEEMEARLESVLKQDSMREQHALRSFLYQLGDQLPFGFLVADENQNIKHMNRNAHVYFNCSEEVYKKPFNDFVDEQLKSIDPAPEGMSLLELLLNKEITFAQKTPQEEPKWFRLSATKLRWAGKDRVSVYIKDCTLQIRRQNLAWSLRSMLGHKLRTPLNGIIAPLSIFKGEADETPLGEVRDLINMAETSAHRLHDTMEQIMDYVGLFHSQNKGDGFLVSKIPQLLFEMAQEMDIPLDVDMSDDFSHELAINMMEYHLDAIFHELFTNAARFNPKKSPKIIIKLSVLDNRLMISFLDDGKHVLEENLSKLCNPFYQEELQFTGEMPGTGLGLSQINQLLWSLGGSINVRNRLDKPGLVVDISIPLQNNANKAAV